MNRTCNSHLLPPKTFKNDSDCVFIDHEQHQHLDPFSAKLFIDVDAENQTLF